MQNKFKIQNSKIKIINQNSKLKILDEIIRRTRENVENRKKLVHFPVMLNSFQHLGSQERRFRNKFGMTRRNGISIIAEIKFASPTNPRLGSAEDLLDRAIEYQKAGADAISVITEKHFFKGDIRFVSQIKKSVKFPVLQKDFIIDEQQIYEAKNVGADALLLIARLIDKKTLNRFVELCFAQGIEPVVEVHNEADLKKAVTTKTSFIAVNARDLDTFEIDVEKACRLLKKIPTTYIKLGFSGIQSKVEVKKYVEAGAKGVLVGTSLMKAKNINGFISSLRATERSVAI